jgi:hypothetical protein
MRLKLTEKTVDLLALLAVILLLWMLGVLSPIHAAEPMATLSPSSISPGYEKLK